ncbi:MAG: hypothetical protein QE487_01385 [Fluviicola sp.]|nr:hypothetical protein [Fluviicola sp.]
MKGLILFITFLACSTLYGQMSENKVHYSFKITEITNEENAKNLNAEISNYFDAMPIFNEADNLFVVNSHVLISKEQFEERMTAKGLHVELFEQTSGVSNATTKY